jgi:hypothetical protein
MSIDDFIAAWEGGSRANRFAVAITWPGLITAPNVRDNLMVTAASLPASILGVANVPYMGRMIPMPGDRTFEDWTITVRNDITFSHRNAFEAWSNAILSHDGNTQLFPTFSSMVTNIVVNQLDRDDNIIKTFTLRNAWPTHISGIDLSYDANDAVETFTVTFAYTDWQSPTTPTS